MSNQPMLFLSEGARLLDPGGREVPSSLVPNGAMDLLLGGGVWEAGFVRQLRPARVKDKPLQLALAREKRIDNGRELLRFIGDVTRSTDPIEWLQRLYIAFPSATPRVPAVHELLDALKAKCTDEKKLAFLLGRSAPRQGRPLNWSAQLQLVCWMNILFNEGMSAAQAAELLKKEWPEAKDFCDSGSLKNLHSKYREYARIFAEGYYIPAQSLRPAPWGGTRRSWRMYAMQ